MIKRKSAQTSGVRVPTTVDAMMLAHEVLTDSGFESIDIDHPHQTRNTWIVPATAERTAVRVHIDPRSGSTRIVEVDR